MKFNNFACTNDTVTYKAQSNSRRPKRSTDTVSIDKVSAKTGHGAADDQPQAATFM
jgi:hypothetical protein